MLQKMPTFENMTNRNTLAQKSSCPKQFFPNPVSLSWNGFLGIKQREEERLMDFQGR